MRLAKFTDLSLRAVMLLAAADSSEPLTTRKVAASVDSSYTHMAKVVSRLQHLGVVEAARGRSGGLWLTGFGRQASVGWLVRELEGDQEAVDCEGAQPCPLRAACLLRAALRRAQEAFYADLDRVTVADLSAPPAEPVLLGLIGRRSH